MLSWPIYIAIQRTRNKYKFARINSDISPYELVKCDEEGILKDVRKAVEGAV
jgi:hypothetical protein